MTTRGRSRDERRLHAVIIAIAAVVAVVMVAAAAWSLTRPRPAGELPATATPAGSATQAALPPTLPAGVATGGAAAPASPAQTGSPVPSSPATSPADSSAHRIAFHIGDTLYITTERGRTISPMHIVGANYALSPDGRTVAGVEKGKLTVASVGQHLLASSTATPGLTAEAIAPIWAPDSSAVYFVRSTSSGLPRIWKLDRATGAASEVAAGAVMGVSPDGRTIAVLPTEEQAVPVVTVSTNGQAQRTFKLGSVDPVAIAVGANRIFVSTISASGESAVWSYAYDGADRKKLVGNVSSANASTTYGELMLSPDGSKLLFAADGDDGYSRLWIVPTSGGTATAISGRRDGYAVAWTRDGGGILFVEGNAFQGQSTALWLTDLTGHRRTKLVDGATL